MSLLANDLEFLVKKVFEIDSYKSKIGDDESVIVVSFTVFREDPAKDLENFIEMGFNWVLDADISPGETDDGNFKVFVELERSRHAPKRILELLDGIERLTGMNDMRYRYFKSFKSKDANLENLTNDIPTDKKSYETATERYHMNNYGNFFSHSIADDINIMNETITFKKQRITPLSFEVVDSGPKSKIYESIPGAIKLSGSDMSEILYFTKYIGNYNITKIGNTFIFENNGWAVALR